MLTWCQEWPLTTETQLQHTSVTLLSPLEGGKQQANSPKLQVFSERLQIDDAIYSGWEKRSRLDAEAPRSLAHLSTGGVVK